ncbi:MAG TPA: class IV adenylate cyclase [Bryobacteraceae bacterium]|jgi:adenylate cyclase class 2|nr:class IV adenylate cyclase [Bryobacteraceae bacterium]
MTHSSTETEIKLAVTDAGAAKKLLTPAGFRVARRRVFERNVVFDTRELTLRGESKLLRVRHAGRLVTVTYKGKPAAGKHKSREELEVAVSGERPMTAIFERLGYRPVFRYEKYRTEYRPARGGGLATVDETPVGTYLELEGSPAWIDRTAARMGFGEHDYITASYARVYLDWCQREGVAPGDMVFS